MANQCSRRLRREARYCGLTSLAPQHSPPRSLARNAVEPGGTFGRLAKLQAWKTMVGCRDLRAAFARGSALPAGICRADGFGYATSTLGSFLWVPVKRSSDTSASFGRWTAYPIQLIRLHAELQLSKQVVDGFNFRRIVACDRVAIAGCWRAMRLASPTTQ